MTTFVALGIALALVGCKHEKTAEDEPKPAATATTGTANAEDVRVVSIEVNEKGYVPDRIPGKPGEKLKLKFTRKIEADCLSQMKTPDGKLVDLPMNKAVEVEVTVPKEGEVKFACGMEMFYAVVVAEKA